MQRLANLLVAQVLAEEVVVPSRSIQALEAVRRKGRLGNRVRVARATTVCRRGLRGDAVAREQRLRLVGLDQLLALLKQLGFLLGLVRFKVVIVGRRRLEDAAVHAEIRIALPRRAAVRREELDDVLAPGRVAHHDHLARGGVRRARREVLDQLRRLLCVALKRRRTESTQVRALDRLDQRVPDLVQRTGQAGEVGHDADRVGQPRKKDKLIRVMSVRLKVRKRDWLGLVQGQRALQWRRRIRTAAHGVGNGPPITWLQDLFRPPCGGVEQAQKETR